MEAMTRNGGAGFANLRSNILLYAFSIAGMLAVATVVYYGLEKPFLRLKSAFAVVESRQDIVEKREGLTPVRTVS